jgi:site-specific recombinase XerD
VETEIEQFERYLRRRYGDRSTPKHYMSDMRIFAQHITNKRPIEVSVQDIDDFVEQQVKQGLRPTTVNRRLATLRTFFEFLASAEPDRPWPNPVLWRRHKVKQGEALPRDLSDATVRALFAAIDSERDRALFGLMIGAGLRVGEVADLQLTDLEAPTLPDQMARLRVRGKGRKERIVWLTPPLYATVQAWLGVRPQSTSEHLFLNQHGRSLSVDGIQYLLKQHAKRAQVQVTCHQLRHTFARRLAEQEMPIESLSKLLGHTQVTTTQIYTAGADPKLRAAFVQAMSELDTLPETAALIEDSVLSRPQPRRQSGRADPQNLCACLAHFDTLPDWLQTQLRAYLTWRWRNWQPHMAKQHGRRLARQLRRIWDGLLTLHSLTAWSDLQRSHIETWLNARQQAGLAASSRRTELSDLFSCLRFVADRDIALSPNLFRVPYPQRTDPLPRYLTELEYRRLEQTVLTQTNADSHTAACARAWFFTLAHTGLRVSELLNLRLADVQLDRECLIVRGGKNTRDRLVYLTPTLTHVLRTYLAHRQTVNDDHLWLDAELPLKDHQIRYRLRRWGQLCDVAVTPHRLRHTLATRLINHGMSLESLRKLLGHRDLRMTQHYARIYDPTVRDQFRTAMANIEGVVINSWPHTEMIDTEQLDVYSNVDSV